MNVDLHAPAPAAICLASLFPRRDVDEAPLRSFAAHLLTVELWPVSDADKNVELERRALGSQRRDGLVVLILQAVDDVWHWLLDEEA